MQKTIFNSIIAGAGTCIGWTIAIKAIAIASDPHQRAMVKQKIKKVKSALKNKERAANNGSFFLLKKIGGMYGIYNCYYYDDPRIYCWSIMVKVADQRCSYEGLR